MRMLTKMMMKTMMMGKDDDDGDDGDDGGDDCDNANVRDDGNDEDKEAGEGEVLIILDCAGAPREGKQTNPLAGGDLG